MDTLFGPAVSTLETSLRLRVARQGVLAANLANADTPRYKRVDLDFERMLEQKGMRMLRTHPSHRGGSSGSARLVTDPRSITPDGNGIELQGELIENSRNAGAFVEQASVLSRLLLMRSMAITGNTA
jgi:flagellar basal-body rod protein FlgB